MRRADAGSAKFPRSHGVLPIEAVMGSTTGQNEARNNALGALPFLHHGWGRRGRFCYLELPYVAF